MQLISLPLSVLLAVLPFLTVSNGQSLSQSSSSASPSASASTIPGGGGAGDGDGSSSTFQLQDYLIFLNSSGYTALSSAIEQASSTTNGQQWISQLADGNWTVFAPTNEALSAVPQNISSNATALSDYLAYHYVHGDLSGPSIACPASCTNGQGDQSAVAFARLLARQQGQGQGQGGGGSDSCPMSCTMSPTGTPSATATPTGTGGQSGFSLRRLFSRQNQGQQGQGQDDQPGVQLLSTVYPNVTIGRTALNSSEYVQLEGDKAQVLAWTRFPSDENVTILNQMTSNNQNVTVNNATHWRNLFINEVNSAFSPPGPITEALAAVNNSQVVDFADQVELPGPDGNVSAIQAFESMRGFTLFAPSSQASNLNQTLQGLDQTDLAALVMNHYINGSTFYSPFLREFAANSSSDTEDDERPLTSAAGQYYQFTTNQTGLFVSVGNDTSAQVVHPDILVENGVIHLIDRVLFQTNNNANEASLAYSSYSAAATQTATDTQAIIFPVPTSFAESMTSSAQSSQTSSSASSTSAGASATPSSFRLHQAVRA